MATRWRVLQLVGIDDSRTDHRDLPLPAIASGCASTASATSSCRRSSTRPASSSLPFLCGPVKGEPIRVQCDVVLNVICDPDTNAGSLAIARRIVDQLERRRREPPRPRPRVVARLRRQRPRRHRAAPSCRARCGSGRGRSPTSPGRWPRRASTPRSCSAVPAPTVARRSSSSAAARTPTALEQFPFDGRDFYATEFVDYRSPDGLYRKYRTLMVGGYSHAKHMIAAGSWNIHARERAEMNERPDLVAEEEKLLVDGLPDDAPPDLQRRARPARPRLLRHRLRPRRRTADRSSSRSTPASALSPPARRRARCSRTRSRRGASATTSGSCSRPAQRPWGPAPPLVAFAPCMSGCSEPPVRSVGSCAGCSPSGASRSRGSGTSPRPGRPGSACRGATTRSRSRTPPRRPSPGSISRCSPTASTPRWSWRPKVVEAGATVIDNSSAWRMDPEVPLVVSEVNPHDLERIPKGIVANPNCTTMAAMPPLGALHRAAGLRRLVVSTYQAVSGAGGVGVDELDGQVRKVADRAAGARLRRPRRRVPGAGEVRRADRLQRPAPRRLDRRRRVVGDRRGAEAPQREPQDPRHPRPARVGDVRAGAGVHRALAVDQRRVRASRSRPEEATEILRDAPGVELADIPTPLLAAGRDPSYVGRIRQDPGVEGGRGLALFVSARQPPQGRRPQRHPDRRAPPPECAVRFGGQRPPKSPPVLTVGAHEQGIDPHFGQPSA